MYVRAYFWRSTQESHLMLHNIGRHHWRKPAGINLNVFWTAQPGALRLARNARNLHLRLLTPSPLPCLRYPRISCPSSQPRNLVNIHRYYVRGTQEYRNLSFPYVDPRESWFHRSIRWILRPLGSRCKWNSKDGSRRCSAHDKVTSSYNIFSWNLVSYF